MITHFLTLTRSLIDFLLPKTAQVLALEVLSTSKLLEILPPALTIKDSNTLAIFDYGHPVAKEIIWEVKYSGNRVLANRLGEILYDVIVSELEEKLLFQKEESILLLPMPISDKRRFERGWNQAELLCQGVKKLDTKEQFKYLPRQLVKIIHTESQTKTANKSERLNNLHNSMKVLNPLSVSGRSVVLIDDVTTTGSTFAEAKRALKVAGARKVLCVAVTH